MLKGRNERGRVILVGAGPGDPDLITVRGAQALGRADIVLYDELATEELLALVPDQAVCINVGKRGHDLPTRSQDDINRLAVEHAGAGRTVVRLKGGDPFVFGRGGEEASACVEAGIAYEVVPGVSSATAALAYAGIPITDRRFSASFAVVTGHKDPSKVAEATRWRELGSAVDTLVILMGMRNLEKLLARLMEGGKPPNTPAAAIMHGTLPEQRVVVSTLAELPQAALEQGFGSPSVVVVGDVVRLRETLSWWEDAPLFGMRALVTRASHQSAELASALRAAGAVPVLRPLIDLVACDDPALVAEVDRALFRLDDCDDVLFASSNAVRFFVEHARRAGVDLAGLRARVLCIGAKTAQTALDAGLEAHFVLTGGRGDAEWMLAEIVRSLSPEGRRVLVPRSDIGRDVLPQGLRAAGSHVDAVTFYCNVRPGIDTDALRADLASAALPILTFTSPSAVAHFAELLDAPARAAAERSIIAAIGITTARALQKVGLSADVVPERPDVREMVRLLAERVDATRRSAEPPALSPMPAGPAGPGGPGGPGGETEEK
ncbi:MAG: uroporphyrinogen-III C-methyltransferase [Deltaproteobacteria bacterium]|nr:uroporphyrinogen-III C-methyltransferase [Deltaproteobacteria bacterium]